MEEDRATTNTISLAPGQEDAAEVREFFTRLIRGMAHDLNNILTVFHGYLSMIEMEAGTNELLNEAVRHMGTGSDNADHLIQRILQASGRMKLDPREQSMADFADSVQGMIKRLNSPCPVEFRLEPGQETKVLRMDTKRVREAVEHLVENAIQACEKSDCTGVSVSLRAIPSAPSRVYDHQLMIEVRDQGRGIPPDDLPHIFTPFFTTRKENKQKGLGLACTTGILRRLHGTISITSNPADGTIATLTIPGYTPDALEEIVKNPLPIS